MNLKSVFWSLLVLVCLAGISALEYYVTAPKTSFTLAIEEGNQGWGYRVFKNDKLLIKQDHIPGVANKQGFATKEDAEKIGRLVLQKLDEGQAPSVTKEELIAQDITK